MVTCGLTVCTLGSAPGPMLDNEYGRIFTFFIPQLISAHGPCDPEVEFGLFDSMRQYLCHTDRRR